MHTHTLSHKLKKVSVPCFPPLLLFFSLLSCILLPHLSVHILKPYITRIKTQCVSQRRADLLVGFLCVCEFYDWGRGPGTQGYISDKVSLWLLVFLALFKPFRSDWPPWIARPHVNATFDLNSWVPEDVAASAAQLLHWLRNGRLYSRMGCNIVNALLFYWNGRIPLKVKIIWQIIGEWVIYRVTEFKEYCFKEQKAALYSNHT